MFNTTNLVRLIAISGKSFEIIRNAQHICNANGAINTVEHKKVIHFLVDTDISAGDWVKLLSTGELFYILETEFQNLKDNSRVLNAYYQTENDYFTASN